MSLHGPCIPEHESLTSILLGAWPLSNPLNQAICGAASKAARLCLSSAHSPRTSWTGSGTSGFASLATTGPSARSNSTPNSSSQSTAAASQSEPTSAAVNSSLRGASNDAIVNSAAKLGGHHELESEKKGVEKPQQSKADASTAGGKSRQQDSALDIEDSSRLSDRSGEKLSNLGGSLVNTAETTRPFKWPALGGDKGTKKEQKPWWMGVGVPDWMHKKMPGLQPFWVILERPGHPDKKRLMTVQDFFAYTEEEGKQFWKELDRDGDGRVSSDDVKAILRKRKLPESYSSDFIKAARGSRWWSNSIDWEEFKGMMDEREPKMLRAFTSLEVNSAGGLEPKSIKGTLAKVGVAETDGHVKAMIQALGADGDGAVSYGKFRNFLMLLPEAKLTGFDPSGIWFEAATVVPFGPPPVERSDEKRTGKMLLTAALAGGIASCVSTVALFPLDTLKTRLQSTAGASIQSIARTAPEIGVRGLYRGLIPAATGNFVSHGVRTFSYEAAFTTLTGLTKGAAELQMQGLSSGIGTFLGTCIRIPCEVLKQRLQTGRHPNVVAGIKAATKSEGVRGLFRGTSATLSREVPFYVLGIVFFEQLKKLAKGSSFGGKGRELAPWETLALGALAGSLASVSTCPADVVKTRIMTHAVDKAVNPGQIIADIIQHEGVGALFKGALFRAAWTAPQGAMNFSGYELAKKALSQQESEVKNFQLEPAA